MLTIEVRNVNEALPIALLHLKENGVSRDSRDGPVLEYPEPVATTYLFPEERVLFSESRDANPFFHLFEALWIIHGRNDVKFLTHFNKQMAQYSDDGVTFHAPYGYRLRAHFGEPGFHDQISIVIDKLRENPNDRQAVLQIYDTNVDLSVKTKDVPCNDMVFLKIRDNKLHMTVCCRSTDVLWGAYGANVVQFSMLQEYIAGNIGCFMGTYTQISDSFHVYTEKDVYKKCKDIPLLSDNNPYYHMGAYPMFHEATPAEFDHDLSLMFHQYDHYGDIDATYAKFRTPFFIDVVLPMWAAWQTHKSGSTDTAIAWASHIDAEDWRIACTDWLRRRMK